MSYRSDTEIQLLAIRARQALVTVNGDRASAATMLGLSRSTLHRLLKADDARVEREMAQNERVATALTKAQPHEAGRVSVQPLKTKAKAWMMMFVHHAEVSNGTDDKRVTRPR
jgi:hypothetical protein